MWTARMLFSNTGKLVNRNAGHFNSHFALDIGRPSATVGGTQLIDYFVSSAVQEKK